MGEVKEMKMAKKPVTLTRQQFMWAKSICETPGNGGRNAVKDIRLIDRVCKTLANAAKMSLEQPKLRELKEGETHTPEEQKEHQEKSQAYQQAMRTGMDEQVTIELSDMEFLCVKERVQGFQDYNPSEQARKNQIPIFDAFGCE